MKSRVDPPDSGVNGNWDDVISLSSEIIALVPNSDIGKTAIDLANQAEENKKAEELNNLYNTLMIANNEQDWKTLISIAGQIHSLSEGSKEDIEAQGLLAIATEKQREIDTEEARKIIRVKRIWCSRPDSAGGVELYFNFVNNSEKAIKYLTFGATFYNSVGDIGQCEIKRDIINYCQETGPYEKGEGLSGTYQIVKRSGRDIFYCPKEGE